MNNSGAVRFFRHPAALCAAVFLMCTAGYAADVTRSAAGSGEQAAAVSFAQKLERALSAGGTEDALILFDSLPEKLKDNVDLLCLKASLLVSAGRYDQADELASQLIAAAPQSVPVLEVSAMVAKVTENKNRHAAVIKQLLAIDPYNSEANVQLAQNEMLKHNYKAANRYYRTSLENEPDNITGLAGLGQTSYYLDNLSEAETAFKRILAIDSHNAVALAYLGKLEAENENWRKALEYVTEAVRYDDSNYSYYLDVGTYSRSLGKFDDAIAAWTKAIQIDPNYFLAYAYRGGLYDERGEYGMALADYKKVIATNPDYYFAYESMGMLAWHEQDWETSRQAFGLARSMMATNPSYPLMIAATYLMQGKKQDCKLFLEQAMKKFNRNSLEYLVMRLYHDGGGINAENDAVLRVKNESNSNKRGKLMYYLGLYFEMKGSYTIANEFYSSILKLNSPMFFEYRLAEWSVKSHESN